MDFKGTLREGPLSCFMGKEGFPKALAFSYNSADVTTSKGGQPWHEVFWEHYWLWLPWQQGEVPSLAENADSACTWR